MSDRFIIPGSEKRRMPGAKKLGPVDPHEVADVTVVLRMPHGKSHADLTTLAADETKHLTRTQFEQEFSADADDIIKIEEFAHAHGLDVLETSPEARSVVLSGPLAALQKTFGVSLDNYQHPDGKFRGRVGAITIPADLNGVVEAVLGLDDRPVAKPHLKWARTHSNPAALLPTDVAKLYQFPSDVDGTGQCIAIIELGGGYRAAELRQYFSEVVGLKMPPQVRAVSVDGGRNKPGVDTDADGEVLLDIEVAGSVAPGARVAVYFAPNTDRGFLDAITKAVHDKQHAPSVISISWGSAEADWTSQSLRVFNQALQVASTLGVTVCAAAGDSGSSDSVTDGHQHVDFPASSPFVLACGGTRLIGNPQDGIASETTWNDNPTQSATGGGISDVFPLPAWQADADVPPSANPNGGRGRGVPDVSGNADPVTGYVVLVDGQQSAIGGTSAVAPLWAGLLALLNQKVGRSLGLIQPFLYKNPTTLRDITVGNNGAYKAGVGWDACTGLGSPNGAVLVQALKERLAQQEVPTSV